MLRLLLCYDENEEIHHLENVPSLHWTELSNDTIIASRARDSRFDAQSQQPQMAYEIITDKQQKSAGNGLATPERK